MTALLRKFNIALPAMPVTPPAHDPNKTTLLKLAVIIGIAVVAHFKIADPWIGSFAVLVFALKVGVIIRQQKPLPRIVMMALTIFSLALILFFYGGWNGQKAGISFLILLVSLKFLESRILRDYYVVCLLLYFLAASTFLFDSSITSIIIVIAYTIAITGILFELANPVRVPWQQTLKSSSAIIIKTLPLAVLLFFFFPRIQGDFGFYPSLDRADANTQLNNTLVAGEMAASAFDNSLAFRVRFDEDIPPREQLYWRAKVMPIERLFRWETAAPDVRRLADAQIKQQAADLNKGVLHYDILHEKSTDLFLPYLDYVVGYSKGLILDDYSVIVKRPKATSFSYKGASSLEPSLPKANNINRQLLLQTQSKPSARLQLLLNQWRTSAKTDTELVKQVYQHFLDTPFNYSLSPPALDEINPVDDFMFDSRTGYCEHFASAFTILMRWSGIPARVVVGYQGGRINNSGKYLEVRYSDAHAWSEVWVNGQWFRVDPTATVSPERIQFGMDAFMDLWDSNLFGSNESGKALANFLNPSGINKYLRNIQDVWKNAGYQWNKWVVNYDFDTQGELLENLGMEQRDSVYKLIGILFCGVFGLMLFYFWQLIPRAIKREQAQVAYLKFVAKFKKHGVRKELSDTPGEFAAKARAQLPTHASDIDKVTDTYQQIRYGKASEDIGDLLVLFKQQVKQFKIRTNT